MAVERVIGVALVLKERKGALTAIQEVNERFDYSSSDIIVATSPYPIAFVLIGSFV